jgi:nitrite reductase/ring-hydroxylating ferredoxin subunit
LFYGIFVTKMILLTRNGLRAWAIPGPGGVLFLRSRVRLVDLSPSVLPNRRNHVLVERTSMQRKQFIIGAGIGLAASVLAACTTYGRKPDTAAGAPQRDGVIAKTSDIPVGSGVIVGEVVVTQAAAGEFKGFSSTCTHAGCTVNEVADGTINCPCHGSKFNLDGSVAAGPATTPLESKAVTVRGDSIVLG